MPGNRNQTASSRAYGGRVRTRASFLRAVPELRVLALVLAALLTALPGGQVLARCFGSSDPVVQRAEIALGRDPGAAVESIAQTIARTDPADTDRIAQLHAVQAIALSMSGTSPKEAEQRVREAIGAAAPTDPVMMFLRTNEYQRMPAGPERDRSLAAIARDYRKLPAGSRTRTCRAVDLAFLYSLIEQPREAFAYASDGYRNSAADTASPARAEAASIMAYLVSEGYDFDYARQLRSEALAIFIDSGMSDLAANELVMAGYMELNDGGWQRALADFTASAEQARSYGNDYAVAYAEAGMCLAALEGEQIAQAAPVCERAHAALSVPGERMGFTAGVLLARLHVAQGRAGRALALLDPLIADDRGDSETVVRIMAHETRAQALAMLGRSGEAFVAMREAKTMADEQREEELRKGATTLRARFKTQELQTSLAHQQRTSDARLRLIVAVIVGAVATVSLLGALIFFLQRHRRRFRHLAMTDPLTGLSNRRATREQIDAALSIVGPEPPRASFALIDIDHFKQCNDRYGHDAGDLVLTGFARIIERCLRPGDVIGRWGGEEFLLITPGADRAEAERVIDRIRAAAEQETFAAAPDFRLRFSAGIAQLNETDDEIHECIRLADRRLYAAKAQGRNRSCSHGCESEREAAPRSHAPD